MPPQFRFAKFVTCMLVSHSVNKTAREVLKNNLDNDIIIDSFRVRLGIYAISGMASTAAWNWTNAQLEELMESLTSVQMATKAAREEYEREQKKNGNGIVETIEGEVVKED